MYDKVFLNAKTFEHIDKNSIYLVDESLAKTIIALNKKGYKTIDQDKGHYGDIVKLDRIINNKNNRINDKDSIKYTCFTRIYITFDKDYNFNNIPEGFNWDKSVNTLFYILNYYNEDTLKLKETFKEIEEELDNKYKLLEKWAENLPDIKERND